MTVAEFRRRWSEDLTSFTADDWLDWLSPRHKQRILSRQYAVQQHMQALETQHNAQGEEEPSTTENIERHENLTQHAQGNNNNKEVTAQLLEVFCARVGIVLAPEITIQRRDPVTDAGRSSSGFALRARCAIRAGTLVCSVPQYTMMDGREGVHLAMSSGKLPTNAQTTRASAHVVVEKCSSTREDGDNHTPPTTRVVHSPLRDPLTAGFVHQPPPESGNHAGTTRKGSRGDVSELDCDIAVFLHELEYIVAQILWHYTHATSPFHVYARYLLQGPPAYAVSTPRNMPYLSLSEVESWVDAARCDAVPRSNRPTTTRAVHHGNVATKRKDESRLTAPASSGHAHTVEWMQTLRALTAGCHERIVHPSFSFGAAHPSASPHERSTAAKEEKKNHESEEVSLRRRAFAQVLSRRFHLDAAGRSVLIPIADLMNHSGTNFNAGGLLLGGGEDSAASSRNEPVSASSTLTLQDVLVNFLAGVAPEAVEEPHYHVITLRDVAEGEELTSVYSEADPNSPCGHAVWNALWGFAPPQAAELNAGQWQQLVEAMFALLLREWTQ